MLTADPTLSTLKAKLFRGLADASRLAILDVLRQGPHTVTQIQDQTGLSQSNTSNHLACLWDCGLVAKDQDGRFVRYRLSDARIATLLQLAETVLAEVARGVYACTTYPTPEDSPPA